MEQFFLYIYLLFIITFVCLSVPTYCILMQLKFSIKLVTLVDLSDSVVRQRDEYEIVTETRPISRC